MTYNCVEWDVKPYYTIYTDRHIHCTGIKLSPSSMVNKYYYRSYHKFTMSLSFFTSLHQVLHAGLYKAQPWGGLPLAQNLPKVPQIFWTQMTCIATGWTVSQLH